MRTSLSRVICILSVLMACQVGRAAPTGYADDFSGSTPKGWAPSATYKVTQADGQAKIDVNKQTMWDGEYLALGGPHDFSANPYINVKVKINAPCILHAYFHDGKNADVVEIPLNQVSDFVTVSFDLSAVKVDLTNVVGIIFAVNGAGNSWSGTITLKDLRVGDQAKPLVNIAGVDDLRYYHDSGSHQVRLTGLQNVKKLTLTGAEKFLQNVAFSPIDNARCTMSFDVVPGATGTATATLAAEGDGKFQPNSLTVPVIIEENLPPTVDAPPAMTAQVGKAQMIRLSGVSDGNIAAEQLITFSVKSDHPEVVSDKDVTFDYFTGGRYATVHLTPRAAGDAKLTITLDDNGGGKSTTQATLDVHAVQDWNHPPTLDPIDSQTAFINDGEQRITLGGVSDGDGANQSLAFSAGSSDESIVAAPKIDYTNGNTAVLRYTPTAKAGTATITVTVVDHGGTKTNNGDQQAQQQFQIISRVRPVLELREDFSKDDAIKNLRAEETVAVSKVDVDAKPALKIALTDQLTFAGLWMKLPAMDLSKTPFLTVDVKSDNAIQFNVYFYDGHDKRNSGATQTQTLKANEWQTVTFNFSGKSQLEDEKGAPIDSTWVTQLLFNFHPTFGWPFTKYTGNLYFRNLRLGTAADVPAVPPTCSVDPIAAQAHLANSGKHTVTLTGINCSNASPVKLAAKAGKGLVTDVAVSPVNADGSATVSYTVNGVGRDEIDVVASANGAPDKTVSFTVDSMSDAAGQANQVSIDTAKHFQTIRGFGTFLNDLPVSVFTGDLGASAMRAGSEMQDFEPVRDTIDPNVINPAAFNVKAFDFDRLRKLHDAGVETFFYSSWSPPAWMKPNRSSNFQQPGFSGDSDNTPNRLDYDEYEEFAKALVQLVRTYKEEAGIDLTAISLQNEPAFHESYGSAILDPKHCVELIKVVGKRFEKEGIKTQLMMPEQVSNYDWMMAYINPLNADAEALKYCKIIAVHGYDDKGVGEAHPKFADWQRLWEAAQGNGPKELWMSEGEPTFTDWSSSMNYALNFYGALEFGNISLWTTFTVENDLVNHNKPNQSFYAMRQFWKFIRPGAVRLSTKSASGDVLVTTFSNDEKHGGKLVSILVNRSHAAQAMNVVIAGHDVALWRVVTTDAIRPGAEMGDLKAGQVLVLPPSSVTTIIEK